MVDSTTLLRPEKVKKPSRTADSRLAMAEAMQTVDSVGFAPLQAAHNQQRADAVRRKFARFGIAGGSQ